MCATLTSNAHMISNSLLKPLIEKNNLYLLAHSMAESYFNSQGDYRYFCGVLRYQYIKVHDYHNYNSLKYVFTIPLRVCIEVQL